MMKNEYLTNDQISSLCMELSLLLHAGIGVADGIHLLLEEQSQDREFFLQMADCLDDGRPLSEAMQATNAFPRYAVGLVQVGERTGRQEEALRALSAYYDRQARLDSRIRSALLYPALLMLLMLIVIVVLLVRVLPVFDEVFRALGGGLSGFAGGLLQLGRLLDAGLPVLCVMLAAVLAFLAAFSTSGSFRNRVLHAWRRRQGGRGISFRVAGTRFAQVMAMCLKSGLPAEEALLMAQTMQEDNTPMSQRIRQCKQELELGAGLAEALQKAELLPTAYCRMLALGLRSGTGDGVMEEIADRMQESCEKEIDAMVGRVEPAMVITTSVLVGMILLSVMLPLMNIMAVIG